MPDISLSVTPNKHLEWCSMWISGEKMHETFVQEKNGFEKNLILKKETKKYSYFSNVTCFFCAVLCKEHL